MTKIKISKFVRFVPGINPTRAQKQFGEKKINYYDQASFEIDCSYEYDESPSKHEAKDLKSNDFYLNEGDVVISNALQLATIVCKNNAGKVLSLNFTKIKFDSEKIDKKYFLFLFNSYKDVRRQKERESQGNGSVLRIPLRSLEEIVVPIAPIDEQRKIGIIYVETLKLQHKLNKFGDLIGHFTNSIIEKSLKEE